MTKIIEAAKLLPNGNKTFRVCLISEGESARGRYPAAFFNEKNAAALAGVLSFPKHPEDYSRPDQRDPLAAIAKIGEQVTIERDPETGLLGFWSDYIVPKTKPHVAEQLEEFADRLALSVFADCDGYDDPADGKFVYTDIDPTDPYRSVDLVIAGGRGGKFQKVAESLGLLTPASATAEEKEVPMEIKDVEKVVADAISPVMKIVEGLVATLEGKAKADLQIKANDAAVAETVESRFAAYDAGLAQIAEAKLTESQADEARNILKAGGDVAPFLEKSKKILAEALALAESGEDGSRKIAENHLGGSSNDNKAFDPSIAGFGEVR